MAFTSSHSHGELATPALDAACATSDLPIICMQDIVDHEYALVDSIPDEERAALMPIIRFVRNTLQDPFRALQNGWTMDGFKQTDTAAMRLCNNHGIDTNHWFHKEMDLEKKGRQGPYSEDLIGEHCALVPRKYAPSNGHSLENLHVSLPWQRVSSRPSSESLYQQVTHKEAHTFDCTPLGNIHTHYPKHDNQADPCQLLRGGFLLSSFTHTGLGDINPITSSKIDSGNNTDNIFSTLDVDSFNLEELRRSLRPPARETDSDGNDLQSIEISDCSDVVGGGDDKMHKEDGINDGYLCFPNQDEEQDASDVEWPLYWGNGMQYHPTSAADDCLRFPKVHRRRRNVTKKAVGWIKKRVAQSLVSRVRHKRTCNLPCCTDCEMVTKRRKASGYGPRKCARLSTMKKIASFSTATSSENEAKCNRGSTMERTACDASVSSESCKDKGASQTTQYSDNSPLATALAMVLMNSKAGGLTFYEASQALVQGGYLKTFGYEGQGLASHVKATLKKCPMFKELKNHRFILKAVSNIASRSLHGKVTPGNNDREIFERELSSSLVLNSQKKEQLLSQILDRVESSKLCQKQHQRSIQCCNGNKRGSSHSEHLQQLPATSTATSGCSSCEMLDSCDVSRKRRHEANDEGMRVATVEASFSGRSRDEKDHKPIRCCRTDGKSWQCSNQAQKGSTYCERHQGRCKKGMVKQHLHVPSESNDKETLQNKDATGQNQSGRAQERKLSMQLRPRRDAACNIRLKQW